jgi:hypothetical protein
LPVIVKMEDEAVFEGDWEEALEESLHEESKASKEGEEPTVEGESAEAKGVSANKKASMTDRLRMMTDA